MEEAYWEKDCGEMRRDLVDGGDKDDDKTGTAKSEVG